MTTPVMVRVACVASDLCGWPRTLDLARKSASQTAVSFGPSGGMFAGGAARSKVWLAYTEASLVICTASFAICGAGGVELDGWQPVANVLANKQVRMRRRTGRPPCSFSGKRVAGRRVCAEAMTRKTLIPLMRRWFPAALANVKIGTLRKRRVGCGAGSECFRYGNV